MQTLMLFCIVQLYSNFPSLRLHLIQFNPFGVISNSWLRIRHMSVAKDLSCSHYAITNSRCFLMQLVYVIL